MTNSKDMVDTYHLLYAFKGDPLISKFDNNVDCFEVFFLPG